MAVLQCFQNRITEELGSYDSQISSCHKCGDAIQLKKAIKYGKLKMQ